MTQKVGGPIPVRTTIFEAMSAKAVACGAINLGQGFPDACGPQSVRAAAARALLEGPQQYPRMRGTDALRESLSRHYAATQGLHFEAASDIVVTSGATEALAAAIFALLSAGDGAIVIEPAYDAYAPLLRRAGATPQFVRLQPPDWRIDRALLEAAVTPATRAILVNDPVNPTGRMLDAAERAAIREVALAHDLAVIADEVWEEVRPDSRPHVSLAAEPGLRERTVKIGSAGKVFQLTGWKVGWACAAPDFAARIAATHQYLTFTTSPALQQAVAEGLDGERGWLPTMRDEIEAGRRYFADGLASAGFAVLPSEATWFLSIDLQASGIALDDVRFCSALVERHGVAAIPVSAFFDGEGAPRNAVRFCHAKARTTIDAALERLRKARADF